jgi:hypothetical protein
LSRPEPNSATGLWACVIILTVLVLGLVCLLLRDRGLARGLRGATETGKGVVPTVSRPAMVATSRQTVEPGSVGTTRQQDYEPAVQAEAELPETEERLPVFSRPEGRGPDLSGFETGALVGALATSRDIVERRKAAKALGDRGIAGSLELSDKERETLDAVVQEYLADSRATDSQTRVEAKQQIERLWHVAAPMLLKHVDDKDLTVAEIAAKSLILMRDEQIVRALIEKGKGVRDPRRRALLAFALSKMTEQRESLIPGRVCLDEEASRELHENVVVPALREEFGARNLVVGEVAGPSREQDDKK